MNNVSQGDEYPEPVDSVSDPSMTTDQEAAAESNSAEQGAEAEVYADPPDAAASEDSPE